MNRKQQQETPTEIRPTFRPAARRIALRYLFSKAESFIYVTRAIIVHENVQKKDGAPMLLSSNERRMPHTPECLNFMRLSLKEWRTRGPVQSCVQEIRGIPDFLWSSVGSLHFLRLSLNERRTPGPVECCMQEIRGLARFLRDVWYRRPAGPVHPHGYRALRNQRLASPNKIGGGNLGGTLGTFTMLKGFRRQQRNSPAEPALSLPNGDGTTCSPARECRVG
jgi:hypothetical protein